MKRAFFALGLAAVVLVGLDQPQAQSTVWFRESFNANPPSYGFGYTFPQESNWRFSHLSTGGWDGGGAAHITMLQGRGQYNLGWWTPSNSRNFVMGDAVYIRFRIRYDDSYRFVGGADNKFILMGHTGVSPQSRLIVFQNTPSESEGCTLGMRDWSRSGNPIYPWATPAFFGLPNATWEDSSIARQYGSIAPKVNIGTNCSPPALVTYGNKAGAPAPGPNSAVPRLGWYHIQIYAKSGNTGQGAFKVWANNNSLSSPTSQNLALGEAFGIHGWNEGVGIGGYVGDSLAQDLGFRIDDFEYGPTFDPAWHPDSPPGTGTQPPAAPTEVRIVR
jgi:hypothetical protein